MLLTQKTKNVDWTKDRTKDLEGIFAQYSRLPHGNLELSSPLQFHRK